MECMVVFLDLLPLLMFNVYHHKIILTKYTNLTINKLPRRYSFLVMQTDVT